MMQKVLAEALGTCFVTIAVIGSGFMASDLTGDGAVQLLINCLATVSTLFLTIQLFQKISGSHFNPMVSIFALSKTSLSQMFSYICAQLVGAVVGAMIANTMFERNAIELATTLREGNHLLLGEFIAAAGLVYIVFAKGKSLKSIRPALISLWILGAYFFTASTSFANPAVTFGRIFTDSFAGIAPTSAALFIAIQVIGSSAGYGLAQIMKRR
jgi:glycerol uptake facilitator-like aquaporin